MGAEDGISPAKDDMLRNRLGGQPRAGEDTVGPGWNDLGSSVPCGGQSGPVWPSNRKAHDTGYSDEPAHQAAVVEIA